METIKKPTNSSLKHLHSMIGESSIKVYVPSYGYSYTFDKLELFDAFQILTSDSFEAYIDAYNNLIAAHDRREQILTNIETAIALETDITRHDMASLMEVSELIGECRCEHEVIKYRITDKTGFYAWYNAKALYSALTDREDMEWM